MGACQHIFVLECSEASKSDWRYVQKLLASKYFALNFNADKLTPVYLDGKTNYRSDEAKRKIENYINRYPGKTYVHFVFDVDQDSLKNQSLNQSIEDYVASLSLPKKALKDIIWFNPTIEWVVLGHFVPKREKVVTAERFYTQGGYELNENNFSALCGRGFSMPRQSNFLSVLYECMPMGKNVKALQKSSGDKKAKKR